MNTAGGGSGHDRTGQYEERTGAPDEGRAAPLKVFVVDDHHLFRAGVRHELSAGGPEFEFVGEAGEVSAAVGDICRTSPDVVLVDVHMPNGGGSEIVRRVLARRPGARFLALSVSDAAEDVIGIIRAGARGYVTKTIATPDLKAALKAVAAGDAVFSPRLAGFVLDAFACGPSATSGHSQERSSVEVPAEMWTEPGGNLDQLTAREQEVLRLIARGYAYKEVARQLFISVKTVEAHVSAVLRKLQLSNRHQLARWALERRL